MPARGRALAIGLALLGILMLAFAVRFFATWGGARLDGEYVISHDSDPYYHLRRLEYLAKNGAPLVDDAFAAAPARFECVWPVTLEYLALGLDAAVFHGERGRDSLLLAAGFLPTLIGLAAVLATFLALARATSAGAALAGAAVAAILPSAIAVSAFSKLDHHGLELLVYVALPAVAAWAWTRTAPTAAAAGALSVGAALFAVDGAYLALVALGGALALLAWQSWTAPETGDPNSHGPSGSAAPQSGASPRRSLRWFFAGAAAGAAVSAAAELALGLPRLLPQSGRVGLGLGAYGLALAVGARGRRLVTAALVALAGGALAIPALVAGAGFLTASADAISPNISEAQPLYTRAPAGYFAVHAALLALAIFHGARLRKQPRASFLTVAAVGGGAIGLLQTKYVYLFGLTAPWAVAQSIEALRSRPRVRAALAVAVALIVGERTWSALAHAPSEVSPGDAAFARLMRRLDETAPPQEVYRPGARPDFTVAVQPSLGPRALYLGRRAVTTVPFWGAPALARQFERTLTALLSRDDAKAEPILDELTARYVLVDDLRPSLGFAVAATGVELATWSRGAASVDAAVREALFYRLLVEDGAGAPALGRFRLVAGGGAGADRVKLFERVAGARIAGRAAPGSEVVLHARVRTLDRDGDDLRWFSVTRAAADGRFAIACPYATEPTPRAASAVELELRCSAGARPLTVAETAVATGATVEADCP